MAQAGQTFYHPKPIPLDDDGFVKSFNTDSDADLVNAVAFFEEFGFVVWSEVLNEQETIETINSMWGVVEGSYGGRLGINRNDPSTWCKRWPGGGPGFLGEARTPQAWRNRTNPKLRKAFETILGNTEIVASVDNFGMLRPTNRVPMGRLPHQEPCRIDIEVDEETPTALKVVDMEEWVTKSKWLHWDMNPFRWVDETMPPYNFSEFGWISECNGAPRGSAKAKV